MTISMEDLPQWLRENRENLAGFIGAPVLLAEITDPEEVAAWVAETMKGIR